MLQHTLDEIKRYPQRSYCPVTQMQKLNRKLAAIAAETNPELRTYRVNSYLQALDIYHVNGRAASLLPQAVPQAVQ